MPSCVDCGIEAPDLFVVSSGHRCPACALDRDVRHQTRHALWLSAAFPLAAVILPTAAMLPAGLFANGSWWALYVGPSAVGVAVGAWAALTNVRSGMRVDPEHRLERLLLVGSGVATGVLAVLTIALWPLVYVGPRALF